MILLARIRELGTNLVQAVEDTVHGAKLIMDGLVSQLETCFGLLKNVHDWLPEFYQARLLEIIQWALPESVAKELAKFLKEATSIAADAGALAIEASALVSVVSTVANAVELPIVVETLSAITQALTRGIGSGNPISCFITVLCESCHTSQCVSHPRSPNSSC
ncbi:hypothetical protein BOTBODRAFT_38029 [Botryobasidium botryosum FD-172 SS1]|uniref:Uncharacterized protein n=1 Tax=Botryobasidium botryosum (strain FD-172 SS1) TaxID=930990 RepID=A0A067M940_BOTB1|nr:hypothetical protein BOTBODRAFT_38029 [Botryobasidium botryosum FD-172 SS1]